MWKCNILWVDFSLLLFIATVNVAKAVLFGLIDRAFILLMDFGPIHPHATMTRWDVKAIKWAGEFMRWRDLCRRNPSLFTGHHQAQFLNGDIIVVDNAHHLAVKHYNNAV